MNVKGINLSHLEMRVTSGFRSLLTYGKKEGDKKWVLLLSRFTRVAIRSTNPRLGKLLYMYTYCMIFMMYGMIGCFLFCFKFPLFRAFGNFPETA